VKYYYHEHLLGYERVKSEGKVSWGEIHGENGFEDFAARKLLEIALPMLRFKTDKPKALEYGCGTGPGACFLAERGFEVDGVDLVPIAIEIAKRIALERNLAIHYEVADICELPLDGKAYDLILDSYCLQCIVMDDERKRLFSAVHARLNPDGYYLIGTACMDAYHERLVRNEIVYDASTGIKYNRYGEEFLIDLRTGIVLLILQEKPAEYEQVLYISGMWCLLNRRHLKPQALHTELEAAGFVVMHQDSGDFICTKSDS